MRLGKLVQLHEIALDKAIRLQELIDFLRHCLHSSRPHAIARQNLRIRLFFRQIFHTGIESATAKRTERHDFFTAQVRLVEESRHRRRESTEPHGIADENHVVLRNVGPHRLDFGQNALFALLPRPLNRRPVVAVVGIHRYDCLDVRPEPYGDFLRHRLRVRRLRIVNHEHFLCLHFRAARHGCHHRCHNRQHHFQTFHIVKFLKNKDYRPQNYEKIWKRPIFSRLFHISARFVSFLTENLYLCSVFIVKSRFEKIRY